MMQQIISLAAVQILKKEQVECRRIVVDLKSLETELEKELEGINKEYEATTFTKNRAFERLKAGGEETSQQTSNSAINKDLRRE